MDQHCPATPCAVARGVRTHTPYAAPNNPHHHGDYIHARLHHAPGAHATGLHAPQHIVPIEAQTITRRFTPLRRLPPPKPIGVEVDDVKGSRDINTTRGSVVAPNLAHDTHRFDGGTEPSALATCVSAPSAALSAFSPSSTSTQTCGPWSSFLSPSSAARPRHTGTYSTSTATAAANTVLDAPCWGGMRAGHAAPISVRKSCAVVSSPYAHTPAAIDTKHTSPPAPHSLPIASQDDAERVQKKKSACSSRPIHLSTPVNPASSTTLRWAAAVHAGVAHAPRPHTPRGGEETGPLEASQQTADGGCRYMALLDLPLLPLRASLHQRRVGGAGSFTTLFIKPLAPSIKTGVHLQPFVPSEGLTYITVKHVRGENVAFVQYATSEAAFQARLWLYACTYRRVTAPSTVARAVTVRTRAASAMTPKRTFANESAPSTPPPSGTPVPTPAESTQAKSIHSFATDGIQYYGDDAQTAADWDTRAGDRARPDHESQGSHMPSSRPATLTTPLCIWSQTALRGAALCEAVATLTSGAALEIENMYTLPIPYTTADQRTAEDGARLALFQTHVPVMSSDWSNKRHSGRFHRDALHESPQDYGRIPSLANLEPVPTQHHPPTMTDGEEARATHTLLIRTRRDYTHLHCDGREDCLAARDGDMTTSTTMYTKATLISNNNYVLLPSPSMVPLYAEGYRLCGCRFHAASVADRCEFAMVSRLLRPHFFNLTFSDVNSFRSYLDPPFRGGCFICFRTQLSALECAQWFWAQPQLTSIFEVEMAKQETLR